MQGLKRRLKILASVIFSVATVFGVAFFMLFVFTYRNIDFALDEKLFESSKDFNSTTFYAYDKSKAEYQPIEISGSLNKTSYDLEDVSIYLKQGIINVEDRIFYEHSGVDIRRTLAAALNFITRREKIYGASTITQQLVKNISGDNEVTLSRKLAEIIRARHIEKMYTKDEILELYLNVIPMSEEIFGVGAASKAYFGKEPSELSPAEAATLIGITNAPTAYNPYNNPEKCKQKRDIVLSVMYSTGVISEDELEEAKSLPVKVIPREERASRIDSWFTETVIYQMSRDFAKENGMSDSAARMVLLGGGYSVFTTMDVEVQRTLEAYFEDMSNLPRETENGLCFAMVVADSESGDLVGIVGNSGRKSGNRVLNHAVIPHVPGSTLKPIGLYAPLIDEGRINAATVFDDVPVSFFEENGEYREYPRNSPSVYDGLICVKDALRFSKNTVAVRLCNLRTPRAVFETLKNDYGFDSLVESEKTPDGRKITDVATSPMALGQLSRGVALTKLTESYGVFVGEGKLKNMRSYTVVTDFRGNVVLENQKTEKQILKPETARIMTELLSDVVRDGTAGRITLSGLVATAGKTGTSGNNRDKVFVGYTPFYTAGIWCGYETADRGVVNVSPDHLEIWDDVMQIIHAELLKNEDTKKEFSKEGLIYCSFCRDSGELFSEACHFDPRSSRMDYAYFTDDNRPTKSCATHVLCAYDSVSKGIASSRCPREDVVKVALIRVENRSFPKQIYVTDAEFVYRDLKGAEFYSADFSEPYFYELLPDGEYVGKSKREKQFNSRCGKH